MRFLSSPHPTHVHLAHFQILERNGKPPLVHERGWKDTVALDVGEDVLVMLRCEQFRGRYMLHCHNLEHEDHAMMTRFDVT
jgi:FtsP/CotA-like multicopper oxidase with cupredoxin domain